MPVKPTKTNVGRSHTVAFPLEKHRSTYINPQTSKPLTGFQWRVYDLVRKIPSGQVTTYGDLARALVTSPRAVGTAMRVNPFAPYIPCHRIVARDGRLTGFFGKSDDEGLSSKAELLRSEGINVSPDNLCVEKSDMTNKLWFDGA